MGKFFSVIRSLFGDDGRPDANDERTASDGQVSVSQNEEKELYSADRPITSDEQDLFGRAPFANRIAQTISRRYSSESLVIAIYGPWGDGKTSTLNLMRNSLEREEDIICLSFNPWHFGSDEQLIRAFFKTLADGLGKSLPTSAEKIGKVLSEYGALLSIAHSGVGSAAKGVGESMSNVALDKLRTRMEAILRDSGKRVVVLIDDIDRLERLEIQAILKLVKLSAGFDYTSYVLAFDDEWVAAAIGEKYGHGGAAAGRDFLEKIVQVPLHLPRPDRNALRKLVLTGVDEAIKIAEIELTQDDADAFVLHYQDGIEPVVTTPRQARLYGNALSFALPTLKGEVHPTDHMLIEGIRIFFPALYSLIRDNSAVFLSGARRHGQHDATIAEQTQKNIADAVADLGIDPKQVGTRLLQPLFPRLASVYGNMEYGADFEEGWARHKRIASKEYFPRYFSYGVPPGDIPDNKVDELLELVAQGQDAQVDAVFDLAQDQMATTQLIRKLRLRENAVAPDTALALAKAVARNAESLPRERSLMLDDWTFRQGAVLVAKMTERIAEDDRRDLVIDVATLANPLPFACECWRYIHLWNGDSDQEVNRLVSEEIEVEMAGIIAQRIREAWAEQPLYKTFSGDTPRLLWYWREFGDADEAAASLRARFDAHPNEMDEFLATHVGTAWGMESGLPHKSDFDRSCYDVVIQSLDAEYVLANLRDRFGAELDDPQYHHGDETPLPRRIAHQFAYVNAGVLAGRQNEDQANNANGEEEQGEAANADND